ncbi:hypothetical protein R5R35_014221 [Gryllus longicercus]|uniref:Accessory gland protein n=1 Tax=Gryllus longicercus TaxID=2509291 RepID=A0AAN9VSM0_9ORTH
MLYRYAFAALCIAVIATQGLAFPQDDKKNELDNVISETDDAEPAAAVVSKASEVSEEGDASEVTSPPAPTTLTVGVTSEAAPSSTAASPAKDHAPSASTPRPSAAHNFSRLIDDIFQIPISVLKAVNTLLSNPFRSKLGSHE